METTKYITLSELNIDCIELKVLNRKALDTAILYKNDANLLYEKLLEFGEGSCLVYELKNKLKTVLENINKIIEEIRRDGSELDMIHSKIRKI